MTAATETPAETLRAAASLMRFRANAASPGPWHQMCMGSDGCQVLNDGHLRERKHVAWSGRKEWKADHADAEYVASMHPMVALAVADWLVQAEARGPESTDYLAALKVAHHYLGEPDA